MIIVITYDIGELSRGRAQYGGHSSLASFGWELPVLFVLPSAQSVVSNGERKDPLDGLMPLCSVFKNED